MRAERRTTLGDGLNAEVAHALGAALAQIKPVAPGALARHPFMMSPVTDLCERHRSLYPTALVSRIYPGLDADRAWLGHDDGHGCAAHTDGWLARRHAAQSFLGRQHLVAAWLGAALAEIDLTVPCALETQTLCLLTQLQELGTLRLFAHSEPGRGYFCLALYRGLNRRRLQVVGYAYRTTPQRALSGAIGDLWSNLLARTELARELDTEERSGQYGEALDGAADREFAQGLDQGPHQDFDPARGPVLEPDFGQERRWNADRAFPCWERRAFSGLALSAFLAQPGIHSDDAFVSLTGRSRSMCIYRARSAGLTLVRVLDPSFYLHSDPAQPLNYDNAFARHWAGDAFLRAGWHPQRASVPAPWR